MKCSQSVLTLPSVACMRTRLSICKTTAIERFALKRIEMRLPIDDITSFEQQLTMQQSLLMINPGNCLRKAVRLLVENNSEIASD